MLFTWTGPLQSTTSHFFLAFTASAASSVRLKCWKDQSAKRVRIATKLGARCCHIFSPCECNFCYCCIWYRKKEKKSWMASFFLKPIYSIKSEACFSLSSFFLQHSSSNTAAVSRCLQLLDHSHMSRRRVIHVQLSFSFSCAILNGFQTTSPTSLLLCLETSWAECVLSVATSLDPQMETFYRFGFPRNFFSAWNLVWNESSWRLFRLRVGLRLFDIPESFRFL